MISALSASDRTTSGGTFAVISVERALMMIDLPAPVSPVITLKPSLNSISRSSIMASPSPQEGKHSYLSPHFSFVRSSSKYPLDMDRIRLTVYGDLFIVTSSPNSRGKPICPSSVKITRSSLDRRSALSVACSGSSIGRLVNMCGHMGVTTMCARDWWRMGPPAASEYPVEPVGVERIRRPSCT